MTLANDLTLLIVRQSRPILVDERVEATATLHLQYFSETTRNITTSALILDYHFASYRAPVRFMSDAMS